MLNQKVADLLNDQINKEFYSAYLYLDFSNFFDDKMSKGSFENIKLNGFSFKIGAMF